MKNNPLEYLSTKQAMEYKSLTVSEFHAFIANNNITAYNPTNPGKRTKGSKLVYKLSDFVNSGTVKTINNDSVVLTLKQALELVHFGRPSFLKSFIKIHKIKRVKPINPHAPDASGQMQQYRKRDIINAINNSRVSF